MSFKCCNNSSSDIIYVKDRQSRWLFANPSLQRLTGKDEVDLLGKTDLEIYSNPDIGNKILESDRRIMESGNEEPLRKF
ncbi:MAG: PAS domain-containing protein [Methanobacterium sp.]|nr:PAS domain-containing protein [Methanobacterium sp.]